MVQHFRGFQAAGISTESTKFGYALTAIGARYSMECRDIILSPPADQPYSMLKTELIKRIGISQEHKTRQLLEHEEIGDRKPSQFLRYLQSLAGKAVGDGMLRTIWLNRLPSYVQPHLVIRTNETLSQLAVTADTIMEATKAPTPQIAEVTASQSEIQKQIETQRREILEQIATLQKSMETMKVSNRIRDPDRHRTRSRSRSTSRGRLSSSVCWYHYKFGQTAQKCQPPCSARKLGNATTPQ
ncbi:uncharacterized protein LOC105203852 [Solenopsis invicta]|uniref:uncharacterized protein LOC105203852 n=1 Tax=Solenopsis invicta TaxID=13686 RepID=UPI000595A687|nr:uncharacterized protein LOC105203852 [Solenopsis invicta]